MVVSMCEETDDRVDSRRLALSGVHQRILRGVSLCMCPPGGWQQCETVAARIERCELGHHCPPAARPLTVAQSHGSVRQCHQTLPLHGNTGIVKGAI